MPLSKAALVALILLTAPPGAAVLAQDCARFAIGGVRPGLTPKEVQRAIGRQGFEVVESGRSGPRTTVRYGSGDGEVLVRFDAEVRRSREARVGSVRRRLPRDGPALQAAIEDAVARFGPPGAGADVLAQGLARGAAIWIDDACGLALSLFRSEGTWWQPEDAGAFLQVDDLDFARVEDSPAHDLVTSREPPRPQTAGAATVAAAVPQATETPERAETIRAEPVRIELPPPEPVEPSTSRIEPERVRYVPPVYPPIAKRSGTRGKVTLSAMVEADGTVTNVRVLAAQPPRRGFEDAAMEAVAQWLYRPAVRDGRPAATEIQVVVEFR